MTELLRCCLIATVSVQLALSEFAPPTNRLIRKHGSQDGPTDNHVVFDSRGEAKITKKVKIESTGYTYGFVCDSCDCSSTTEFAPRGNYSTLESCEQKCNGYASCKYIDYLEADKDCYWCGEKGGANGWTQRSGISGHKIYKKEVAHDGTAAGPSNTTVEPCPAGYTQLTGDCPRTYLVDNDGLTVNNIHDCGTKCDEKLACKAFQYSPTTRLCFRLKVDQPTHAQAGDYDFCSKTEARGGDDDDDGPAPAPASP